jgi:hypothetical protein
MRAPSLGLLLAACLLAAFAAVEELPRLDARLGTSGQPGAVTLLGTGVAVSALAAVSLYALLRWGLRLRGTVVGLVIAFNVLVVLVKLSLGPKALYVTNASQSWVGTGGTWQAAGLLIFTMYAAVFLFLAWLYRRRALRAIAQGAQRPVGKVFPTIVLACFFAALVYVVVGIVGSGTDALASAPSKFEEYLAFALSGAWGLGLLAALVAAVAFATAAFDSLAHQAVALQSATILASFLFVGLAFLAIDHVLWVSYVLLLVTLWPLRTVTFSGK